MDITSWSDQTKKSKDTEFHHHDGFCIQQKGREREETMCVCVCVVVTGLWRRFHNNYTNDIHHVGSIFRFFVTP